MVFIFCKWLYIYYITENIRETGKVWRKIRVLGKEENLNNYFRIKKYFQQALFKYFLIFARRTKFSHYLKKISALRMRKENSRRLAVWNHFFPDIKQHSTTLKMQAFKTIN